MIRGNVAEKRSFCSLCKSRCGAIYKVRDGKLISAGPFPEHPTGKALCLKGKAAPEILYSSDRVLYPMRRTNPKSDPDPGWQRITWEEALNEIATRLSAIKEAHGAEAVAFGLTTPSGTPISDGDEWIDRFTYAFGTPNNVHGTEICNWHKDNAHKFTFGSGILYPDYANADTILLWGFNPSAVWLDQATQVAEARARGGKIIAVDPRDAGYARDADHWLRVLPGRDGILAMGLAKILIEKSGYDKEFLTNWSNGPFLVRQDTGRFLRSGDIDSQGGRDYVALSRDGSLVYLSDRMDRQRQVPKDISLNGETLVETDGGSVFCKTAFELYVDACQHYPLENTASQTGIPIAAIEAAAETLAGADKIAYYAWSGLAQQSNATQTDRALAILMSLSGSYDAPGGNVAFSQHPTNLIKDLSLLPKEQLDKALGVDVRPLGPPAEAMITSKDFYTAVLEKKPYEVKTFVSFGANHLLSHGDTDRAIEAFQALEFFAHCNTVMTPTAMFADIFLPVNTPWEREALRVGFDVSQGANELVQLREALVPSRGETRSDMEIVFDLAARLGLGGHFFGGDIDKAYAYVLEPSGISLEELRENPGGIRKPLTYQSRKYAQETGVGVKGFETDTGRVEIYSELFLRHGYSPLPEFTSFDRDTEKYPFELTSAKSGYYCHSQYRNITSLRKRVPEPVVELCQDAADELGFEEDDLIWIENDAGRANMKLKINNALHPRVVVAAYGWWQENKELRLPGFDPLSNNGSNYNRLIETKHIDPISGSVPHRSAICRLRAMDEAKKERPAWLGFRPATIATLQKVADGVTRVGIQVKGLDILPDYQPGQHITLRIKLPETLQEITRCYSLVGSATGAERKEYVISVRRVVAPPNAPDAPPGIMSSFINDGLEIGTEVELKAPSGRFVIPAQSDDPIAIVAGGIGITPFLSYLETVAAVGTAPRIHLVYANRHSAVHAYGDRIKALQEAIPSLGMVNIYNEPASDDVLGVDYDKSGFVGADDILLAEFETVPQVYLCGPPPMMSAVEDALAARGHPPERVYKEVFVSPVSTKPIPTGPYCVSFAKSGVTAQWTDKSGSLLEFGEKHGLSLDSGCRAGQCESCAVGVESGSFQHLLDVAAEEEGRCLICQAVPTGNLVLDA